MDSHQLIEAYLARVASADKWSEMRAVLQRAAAGQPRAWLLARLGCEAVGGAPELALPATAGVAAHQIAIILADDMLDADPRGAHHHLGYGMAANLALAFQAAGCLSLLNGGATTSAGLAATHSLSAMALTVAHGQALDVRNPADEPDYWRLIALKSGPFFGAALEAGALLGGAAAKTATGLYQLGHIIGEMIQLHDDLSDSLATPANPDWLAGRLPLPILYAQTVPHPDQARFAALRGGVADPARLEEAQAILLRSGAVSYCIYQLQERERAAREHLACLDLVNPSGLSRLLDELISPVNDLLAELASGALTPPARPAGTDGPGAR